MKERFPLFNCEHCSLNSVPSNIAQSFYEVFYSYRNDISERIFYYKFRTVIYGDNKRLPVEISKRERERKTKRDKESKESEWTHEPRSQAISIYSIFSVKGLGHSGQVRVCLIEWNVQLVRVLVKWKTVIETRKRESFSSSKSTISIFSSGGNVFLSLHFIQRLRGFPFQYRLESRLVNFFSVASVHQTIV